MQTQSRPIWTPLAALTLIWGLNWPVMKLGVHDLPPWFFRAISMVLGSLVLWLWLRWRRVPLAIAREHWPTVARLCLTNTLIWHVLAIVAVARLSGGRSAVLGYTMPVFAALYGWLRYRQRLDVYGWVGILAALGGVLLLLGAEARSLHGSLDGVLLMLIAAAAWGIGTQQMRHSQLPVSTAVLSLWLFLGTLVVLLPLSWWTERAAWRWPDAPGWFAILYNALLVFALVHVIWFDLARRLSALASSLSIMLVPVIGVYAGALWLGEPLAWQDHAAVVLMLISIFSVVGLRGRMTPSRAEAN